MARDGGHKIDFDLNTLKNLLLPRVRAYRGINVSFAKIRA
jgi:hypothetical protein